MKVTIWIPDKLVEDIKESAWEARTSLSNYLVKLHRSSKAMQDGVKPEKHKSHKLKTEVVSDGDSGRHVTQEHSIPADVQGVLENESASVKKEVLEILKRKGEAQAETRSCLSQI